jgi:hypothetical protein
MEPLEVLITLPLRKQYLRCTTGTVSVPTTVILLQTFTVSGTASATGTINDNDAAPKQSLLLRLPKEVLLFEFSLSNPSACRLYTFTFTNGTAGSADYTTTSQTVTYLRVLLRELRYQTADDCKRPLLLPLERLRLLEQSMIMMRLNCATITPAGYRRKSCCVWIQLEQPLLLEQTIPSHQWNCKLITLPLRKQ